MLEEYKKTVDAQHAPKELVQETLQKMYQAEQQENRNTNQGKRRFAYQRRVYQWTAGGIVLTAAVILFVFFTYKPAALTYQELSLTMIRGTMAAQQEQEKQVIAVGDKQVIVRKASEQEVIPKELLEAKSVQIEGRAIHLGKVSAEEQLCAAGEKDGMYFYMYGYFIEEQDFEQVVRDYLKN